MPVKIRLMRIGAKKRPFYRVVAVDERKKRTGQYLELLGTYNPLTNPKEIKLKQDRIDAWMKNGAVLSTGFLRIIGKNPQKPPRKPKKAPAAAPAAPAAAPVAEEVAPEEAAPVEETTPTEEVTVETQAAEETVVEEAAGEETPVAEETPVTEEVVTEEKSPEESEA